MKYWRKYTCVLDLDIQIEYIRLLQVRFQLLTIEEYDASSQSIRHKGIKQERRELGLVTTHRIKSETRPSEANSLIALE